MQLEPTFFWTWHMHFKITFPFFPSTFNHCCGARKSGLFLVLHLSKLSMLYRAGVQTKRTQAGCRASAEWGGERGCSLPVSKEIQLSIRLYPLYTTAVKASSVHSYTFVTRGLSQSGAYTSAISHFWTLRPGFNVTFEVALPRILLSLIPLEQYIRVGSVQVSFYCQKGYEVLQNENCRNPLAQLKLRGRLKTLKWGMTCSCDKPS